MTDGERSGRANGGEPVTERYVRQALTQTAKGWKYETTVSVRTTDNNVDMMWTLQALNNEAREQAIAEIAVRQSMDDSMVQRFTDNLMATRGRNPYDEDRKP